MGGSMMDVMAKVFNHQVGSVLAGVLVSPTLGHPAWTLLDTDHLPLAPVSILLFIRNALVSTSSCMPSLCLSSHSLSVSLRLSHCATFPASCDYCTVLSRLVDIH